MKLLSATSICISVLLATVLISGKATINFVHTPKIDVLLESRYYKVAKAGNTTRVYLSDTIGGSSNYRELIDVLVSSRKGDIIEIYLAGYGGHALAAMDISIAMQTSRGKVVTVMYGNVYSAHAIIASNGHEVRTLNPNIKMMFHRAAIKVGGDKLLPKKYCAVRFKGSNNTDRGIDSYDKCMYNMKEFEESLEGTVALNMKLGMTPEELQAYREGHDVSINSKQFITTLDENR